MRIPLPRNDQISAIIPDYTPTGDRTILYTAEKQIINLSMKTSTIIHRLAMRQSVDLCYLKANTSRLTNVVIWQPLVLAPDLLLVPFKIRKPKFSGDSTCGYLNFHQIDATYAVAESTFIRLKSGQKIAVLWKPHTVADHLQRAYLAALAQRITIL